MSKVIISIAPLLEATKYHPSTMVHIKKFKRAVEFEKACDRIWKYQSLLDSTLNPLKSSDILACNEHIIKPYISEVALLGVHLIKFREAVDKESSNQDVKQYFKDPIFRKGGSKIRDAMLKDLADWSMKHRFTLPSVSVILEHFHMCFVEHLDKFED